MTMLKTLIASLLLAAPAAAPLMAQEPPPTMPPASPPPPTPARAPLVVPPPADAVAQCNDLSFVVSPAEPAACATRGGIKVRLPGPRRVPVTAAAAPAVRAAPAPAGNEAPPAGATMRCRDGSWLSGAPSESRCERNGGLAVILPAPPPVPPRAP
jgi:hypothetical protein